MKKKLLMLFLIILSIQSLSSQETVRKGAHQQQKEEFGAIIINAFNEKPDYLKEKIKPIIKKSGTALNKIVFGFLPYWEQSNGANTNMQYNLISHLACFDFLVQLDASITPPAGWPWTTEINTAHAAGTKVIMTVVNFGGADGADDVAWELFTNTTKRDLFFINIKNFIQNYNLDGVNIDFEGMTSAHRGVELNTFMFELTSYIHTELSGKEVSFDGPAVNWGGWYLNDLVNSVDYLIIMAYNYTGAYDGYSGPVSPLIHPTSSWKSVTKTLQNSYSIPVANAPEKLVLAVPYYGRHWKTTTSAPESTTISYVGSTRYRNTVTEATSHGGFIWNSDFEYPWYKWHDGSNWNQVWTDNELSLEMKFDLAISNNLGGIGIWALNYDGSRPELWDLINTKFFDSTFIEESITNSIQIYPNPSTGTIQLDILDNLQLNKIEVCNLLGQTIMKIHSDSQSFDIGQLSNGTYLLKIEDTSGKGGTIKVLKFN